MIIRDLYRCPADDLRRAIASSRAPLVRRGMLVPPEAFDQADLAYLEAHPAFDPSLSFVAYDARDPVAFLVSRIEGAGERAEAVWSLLGGQTGAGHALEMLLDDAMDHWRREGARQARQGPIGLLASAPRLDEETDLLKLLAERDFEVQDTHVELAAELKTRGAAEALAAREGELRQKGYAVGPARPDDVAIVARQFHPRRTGHLTQEFWNCVARHLRPEALTVVEQRRLIVGYAAYLGWTLDGDAPHLGPLHVEGVHRGIGLEDILLHHALDAMRQLGKPRVAVTCGTDRAGLYERAGFAVTARFCHEARARLE
jgi:hypothetical protein